MWIAAETVWTEGAGGAAWKEVFLPEETAAVDLTVETAPGLLPKSELKLGLPRQQGLDIPALIPVHM